MKNDDVIKEKEIVERFEERFVRNVFGFPKAEELKDFLLSEIKRKEQECYEQMSEIIGEDEMLTKYFDPEDQRAAKAANQIRAEQRSKLQALKDKD